MHMLNHLDPAIYEEVLRKQTTVWADLTAAVRASWNRSQGSGWSLEVEISMDEVLADLNFGRE